MIFTRAQFIRRQTKHELLTSNRYITLKVVRRDPGRQTHHGPINTRWKQGSRVKEAFAPGKTAEAGRPYWGQQSGEPRQSRSRW